MNKYRITSRVVGIIYLAGLIVSIAVNLMIQSIFSKTNRLSDISANSMRLAIGASLWLIAYAGDAAHGNCHLG
jgi:hypothetical protein